MRLSLGFLVGFLGLMIPSDGNAQTLLVLGESATLDFTSRGGAPYPVPEADDVFLHVSISERRLDVLRNGERLHSFPVGVGTGALLRRRDDAGAWRFDTPTGVFSIGRKKADPRWYAPDWYYVEKGLPMPPAYSEERYFDGMLGDYALYLSDEIAIHGTRDENSVGRAASHGCLRLTNEAIAIIFPLVEIGTTVLITS